MGVRSLHLEPSVESVKPSDQPPIVSRMIQLYTDLLVHEQNKVLSGLLVGNPTTPSSQLTGAAATTWNVDITPGLVTVDGVCAEIAEQVDFSIHSATQLCAALYEVVAAIVVKNVSGTLTCQAVKGDAALTTAGASGPLDGTIQAAVGAGNHWIKIAEIKIQRTADTVVAQTQNNAYRPLMGINVLTS
jgi:hypothetical protein